MKSLRTNGPIEWKQTFRWRPAARIFLITRSLLSVHAVLVGFGLLGVGLVGRYVTRRLNFAKIPDLLRLTATSNSKYYRGGFEAKMSRREAALILGVRYFVHFLP
ncbi:translocase of the inner mitochondrial membrane 14 isoform d [Paragonimus westermani]|uniref:Translocase of the inner mitochondrial membrane 14 isoform d n=1 Tax=Paragonimus westermani TaxID=34504 RepID=A0A8T0DPL1_9TREM|nr:translocase of the inner mitochondrial membrane 14 isoform d [Paragonimus westermani]